MIDFQFTAQVAGFGSPFWIDSYWFVEMGLKSSLICLLLFVILAVLRRCESAGRHRLIVVSLVGLIVLPAASALLAPRLPNWSVPIFRSSASARNVVESSITSQDVHESSSPSQVGLAGLADKSIADPVNGSSWLVDDKTHAASKREKRLNDTVENAEVNPVKVADSLAGQDEPSQASTSWMSTLSMGPGTTLAFVWGLGTITLLLYWILARIRVGRIVGVSQAVNIDEPEWEFIKDVATRLEISARPRVRLTSNEMGPMVMGLFRSTLLLPPQFCEWSESQQRSIVAHELAHVARRDLLTDAIGRIAHAMFWWNPLLTMVRRSQEQEREKACDELAITLVGTAEDYAQHLVAAVRDIRTFTVAPCISMARSSNLRHRVVNILEGQKRAGRFRRVSIGALVALLMIMGVLTPLGITTIASENEGPRSTASNLQDSQTDDNDQDDERAKEEKERAAKQEAWNQDRYGDKITQQVSCEGIVVDTAGKPVPNATVCLRESPRFRRAESGDFSFMMSPSELDEIDCAIATTETNASGEFEFSKIRSKEFRRYKESTERWSVVAKLGGHAIAWARLDSNEQATPVKITVEPEFQFSGQVVDPEGKAVAGAKLYLDLIHPLTGEMKFFGQPIPFFEVDKTKLSPTVTTDASGNFTMKGLPPNQRLGVRVFHPDFIESTVYLASTDQPQPKATASRDRTGRPNENEIEVHSNQCKIELSRGYCVQVKLADEAGKPIANQAGTVYRKSVNRWTRFETDESGSYRSPCFEQSDLYLVFQHRPKKDDWMDVYRKIEFAEGEHEKDLKVQVGIDEGSIYGIAKDETGKPVPDIHAYFIPTDQFMGSTYSVIYQRKTNQAGEFQIPCPAGVPGKLFFGRTDEDLTYNLPTEIEVGLGHKRQESSSRAKLAPVITVDGQKYRSSEERVSVTINRAVTLSGQVVDSNGVPFSDPIFELLNGNRFKYGYGTRMNLTMPVATSNMAGEFEIAGIQDRFPLIFKVTDSEGKRAAILRYDVAKENPTGIQVKLGTDRSVKGIVTLDGKPLPDQEVSLAMMVRVKSLDGRPESGYSYNLKWEKVTSDKDGKYQFFDVPRGGQIELLAKRSPEDRIEASFYREDQFVDGVARKDFKFETLSGFVAGIVVDPDGNPLKNAQVSARQAPDPSDPYGRTRAYGGDDGAWDPSVTGDDGKFKLGDVPENAQLQLFVYYHPTQKGGPGGTSVRQIVTSGNDKVKIVVDPSLARKPKKRR